MQPTCTRHYLWESKKQYAATHNTGIAQASTRNACRHIACVSEKPNDFQDIASDTTTHHLPPLLVVITQQLYRLHNPHIQHSHNGRPGRTPPSLSSSCSAVKSSLVMLLLLLVTEADVTATAAGCQSTVTGLAAINHHTSSTHPSLVIVLLQH